MRCMPQTVGDRVDRESRESTGELLGGRVKAGPWGVLEHPHPGDSGRPRMGKCFLAPNPDAVTSGRRAGPEAFCDLSK